MKQVDQIKHLADSILTEHNALKNNQKYLIAQIIRLLHHHHPEGDSAATLIEMLQDGSFPVIADREGDLRIDGRLSQPDSLKEFLKEIM